MTLCVTLHNRLQHLAGYTVKALPHVTPWFRREYVFWGVLNRDRPRRLYRRALALTVAGGNGAIANRPGLLPTLTRIAQAGSVKVAPARTSGVMHQ